MATQVREQLKTAYTALAPEFGYTNVMAAPRMVKVVLSTGTGKRKKFDKNYNAMVADRLMKITGQKPSIRKAKQSIAGFKMRAGDEVGLMVTLRGERMKGFLEKLFHIAFPRTKDFRGVRKTSVDGMGNMTLGIKEHTIFPETSDEDLTNVFGIAITLVSTATSKAEATAFFTHIGVPFATTDLEPKKKRVSTSVNAKFKGRRK